MVMIMVGPNIVVLDEENWGEECDDFMDVCIYRVFIICHINLQFVCLMIGTK